MNSSNSFNICPRCGNSNSLNAKYCSRCGATLKIPTEAVVCHKCHTRNSSLANFCRNCGATLKVGAQTKICPRCGREIGAEENMCACGYSFVTLQQAEPKRADVSSTNKESKKDKKRKKDRREEQSYVSGDNGAVQQDSGKKVKQKKSGRGFAFFALLFLLVFAYAIIAPSGARPQFLINFDKGFYNHPTPVSSSTDEQEYVYGWSLISETINLFTDETHKAAMSGYEGGAFKYMIDQLGSATFVMMALLAAFLITAVFHLIVCIARLISPKRSKHANLLYLILAIISTVLVALMLCAHFLPEGENFVGSLRNFFTPKYEGAECAYGLALIFIPVYYWFFWLYSHIAKKKSPKKDKKAK